LDDYVLSDVTSSSIYWTRLDSIVVTWILGTLSLEFHEIVREPTESACQAWLTLEAQFLDNCESCILQLDAKFCVFKQGNLSVGEYCCWMKGIINNLHVLG
jgi:hypothetical protein